ncbi:uncharacterized protein LOC135338466 [Halichondria panicea]|uniref:uncharacterized protein LOC135338466 n=1 Tax=Halichondria panicea TaxID=6063 RepID=UPI00312B4FA3
MCAYHFQVQDKALLVNIPALSARTIQRGIASSDFTITSDIQVASIEQAAAQLPGSRWWIKSDGCDVVSGLMVSMKNMWNGDVDFGDGLLQKQYSDYLKRLEFIDNLSVCDEIMLISNLQNVAVQLKEDGTCVDSALRKAQKEFEEKSSVSTTDKVLYALGWNVDELSRLNQQCRSLLVEVSTLKESIRDQSSPSLGLQYAVGKLQGTLKEFVKAVTRHQRTPATHVLVTMISPSERNHKPYALPIACIPYVGLSEAKARSHISAVAEEMVKQGLRVEGFVSNGEYNVFRHKGYTRPLSVFQIQSQARKKYSSMSVKRMKEMITSIESTDGSIQAVRKNPAVSASLLKEIHSWKRSGASLDDIVDRLRSRCVPPEYVPKPWMPGRKEDLCDKLRSIMSQLEYTYQICTWDDQGVPFKTHFYVPEVHPTTKSEFHEREDDAHILKRMATSTRCGGPNELKLERFSPALEDPLSGLTYAALTGQRKQSVRDAERLFSSSMKEYMKKKKYDFEEKYITVILNWRRASDERGLSESERSIYNLEMLEFIKDDLIPWHKQCDLSSLEVNRLPVKIRGFTREVLIALTTTIESKEWIKNRNLCENMPPEHPRSSSTDDVECFFSLLRSMIGNHFTVKDVRFVWRKLCNEFAKRLNKDLPFFYYTSTNERFIEADRPSFEVFQRPKRNPRHQRVRTREQPGNLAPGRATLVQAGAQSIRRRFHNLPIELPPPPLQATVTDEHSYAQH